MLGFLKKFFWSDELSTQSRSSTKSRASRTESKPAISAADALNAIKSPEISTRKAALEVITDLTVLADRANNESDSKLKQLAFAKLKSSLINSKRDLSERMRTLPVLDVATLEFIAKSAPEISFRKSALERCTRVGFLGDRAIADPDAMIRLALLERIDTPATLERIAEAARTKDKALYRAASEKLSAARFAAGDQKEIDARAQKYCEALDALLRDPPETVKTALAQIEADWNSLSGKANSSLTTRFLGAKLTLERVINPPAPAPIVEPHEPGQVELRSGLDLELADLARRVNESMSSNAGSNLARLDKLQQQMDARATQISASAEDSALLASVRNTINAERAKAQASTDALNAKQAEIADLLRANLKQFGLAVEAGDLNRARELERDLLSRKAETAQLFHASDKRHFGDHKAKLAKLLGWERWSANKHRVELCEEAEALPARALHPDALQAKITELKARWAELDRLDGLDEDAAKALGIGKRFRALCFAAVKPAQGYFDKRKELRKEKQAETQTLIDTANALLVQGEAADSKALLDARSDLSERMRNLDQLEPKARAELSKRIREINDKLSELLRAQRAQAEAEKRKLLAKLRRELIGADSHAAVSAAKSAQMEWKKLARADRKVEDELWAELRGLVDPHFEQVKQTIEKEKAEQAEKQAAGRAIIDRAQTLVAQAQTGHSVHSELEKLEGEWRAYRQIEAEPSGSFFDDKSGSNRQGKSFDDRNKGGARGPRKPEQPDRDRDPGRQLERQFDQVVQAVQNAVKSQDLARADNERELTRVKSDLCLELERAWLAQQSIDIDAARARFTELGKLPNNIEQPLAERLATILAGIESHAAPNDSTLQLNAKRGAEIAMALEYLSGRESPEPLKAQRMQYQVQRLGEKMKGGTGESAADEMHRLRNEWLQLGPLATADREALSARIAL
jgi:DNA repair protein SbcC/Rad50